MSGFLAPAASAVLNVDGTTAGVVTIPSTSGFYVGSRVWISGTALTSLNLVVSAVGSNTLSLKKDNNSLSNTDVSAFTVAAGSRVDAPAQFISDTVTTSTQGPLLITGVNSGSTAISIPAGTSISLGNTTITESGGVFAVFSNYVQAGAGMIAPSYAAIFNSSAIMTGTKQDGATAVAVVLDNNQALANAASKLVSIRNNGVEKAYVTKDGGYVTSTGIPEFAGDMAGYTTKVSGVQLGTASSAPGIWLLGSSNTPNTSNYVLMNAGPTLVNAVSGQSTILRVNNANCLAVDGSFITPYFPFKGTTADGPSAVSVAIDSPAYSNAGAKLLSIRNNTAEKLYVDKDGKIVSQGGASFQGSISVPDLTTIQLGVGVGIQSGAAGYTGLCRSLPDGSSWPMPATRFHTGTAGANVSTGETTLQQDAHMHQFGNVMDVAGRGWRIRAWGTFAANTNAKTIKLKFGPTQTDVTGGAFTTSTNGGSWELEAIILRTTGTSAQTAKVSWRVTGTVPANSVVVTSPTEATASNDWAMTLTGTGGASNDIANAFMRIDFEP
jgi:hypothetical protein